MLEEGFGDLKLLGEVEQELLEAEKLWRGDGSSLMI
jgi:hypothetical protein